MKSHVAYRLRVTVSLLIVTALAGSVMFGQTKRRSKAKRSNNARQQAVNAPRSTLIICQGVPVPDGFTIIAYLTSTACPHGAYVLKKQDPYSESLAARYAKPPQSPPTQADDPIAPVAANSTAPGRSQPSQPAVSLGVSLGSGDSVDPSVTPPGSNGTASQPAASQPRGSVPQLSGSTASSNHRGPEFTPAARCRLSNATTCRSSQRSSRAARAHHSGPKPQPVHRQLPTQLRLLTQVPKRWGKATWFASTPVWSQFR